MLLMLMQLIRSHNTDSPLLPNLEFQQANRYPNDPLGLANAAVNTIAVSDSRIESNYALYIEGGAIGLAYNILSAVNNSVITLLTAGRIWWIHREVRAYGSFASDTLIQSVCRIIFESGVIYPLCQIIHLIEVNTVSLSAAPIDLYPLLPLSAAIAPTLIMVRAKLGKNVENLQDSVSDIRFNTKSAQREGGYIARSQTHVQTHTTGGLDLAEPFETGKLSNDKVVIAPV
ncbi:hypothetical protein VNI00_007182 [Paramarasmius palmivorus]|uniref:Uncharacterized protein n=1 Tax=Paramarasmius palmivorus TaxID=297713 RepID=A0AAW0D0A7_9AGAR